MTRQHPVVEGAVISAGGPMDLRWKLNWKALDRSQLETAAGAIRKLHPALTVSHEVWRPPGGDHDVASIDVAVPRHQADHILRTLEPDSSYPGTLAARGHPEGDAFRVSLGFKRRRGAQGDGPGDYHLELSDDEKDNDPCWGVACALAERVAPIVGGVFSDDGDDDEF